MANISDNAPLLDDEADYAADFVDPDEEQYYEHYRFVADKGQVPLRIDKFLLSRLDKSRNKIQAAARAECILVNDKPVKPNYRVRPNDTVSVVLPRPVQQFEITPEPLNLPITYEDETLLIINKPPGLVVHPGCGHYSGTLVNGLAYHLAHLPTNEGENFRPGLVHRIDKDTSGLLVIAKTDEAMTHLAKQFFDHTVYRRYVALVWGNVANDSGTITGNIGRHPRYRQSMAVYPDGDQGKHAITHYRVLERLGYVTLVECRLETGRTHQIRVHFQYIGHPLFNDEKYGGNRIVKGTIYTKYKQFVENCFEILPRQALHAQKLGLKHPADGRDLLFDSPLPDDFHAVVERWQHYMADRL